MESNNNTEPVRHHAVTATGGPGFVCAALAAPARLLRSSKLQQKGGHVEEPDPRRASGKLAKSTRTSAHTCDAMHSHAKKAESVQALRQLSNLSAHTGRHPASVTSS